MQKKRNKAQSIMETLVFLMVIISALVAMKVFMTRAMQQKYKESVEVLGGGEQFEKGVTGTVNEYSRNVK